MIGLVSFLNAAGINIDAADTKVHLACWNGREHPLDVFLADQFQVWQEHQTRRNFPCKHVLSLIDLGQSRWLFAGIYDVLSCTHHPNCPGHTLYSTQLQTGLDKFIGRVIVEHVRTRQSYIWLRDLSFPIVEIRAQKMTVGDFPGYNAVRIRYVTLRTIVHQKIASWHAALGAVKGIYLITDTESGKHYVGKASGDVGIWQRWCDYAADGHGGNAKLKALLQEKGAEHMSRFEYVILEIADTHASEQDILARESYWMDVLKTREFGLN